MSKKLMAPVIIAVVLFVAVIGLGMTAVYVPEDKFVCIKRFEEIVKTYDEPGLYFKVPFIETTTELPKNALTYNLIPSEVLTLDKKAMIVSSYAVWKINDPKEFLRTAVSLFEAERMLDANIFMTVKNSLSSMEQTDATSARGNELDEKITSSVKELMIKYGIEVVDVQIKQFDLPTDNKQAVYQRMISERSQIAAQYSAEGKSEAEIIRNAADKDKAFLISDAKAKAEQLKAEGESQYMRTLAEAYQGEDRAEFYEFMRSMDALKTAMKGQKTIILPLDSPLTKWFIAK